MKPTVVILLSDKRSGSTMFQRELCRHSAIRTVEYSPHTYLETHHWLKAAVMLDLNPTLFSGGKVYEGYGSKRNARTYMEDCIRRNVPDLKIPSDDRALVFEGWNALCKRFAQPVFFEKSPQFLAHWGCLELMLEWIRATDFDVKVVGLVRNPLSVMYSAQELFHTDPIKRQSGWVEIHENLERLFSELDEEQGRIFRYEEIIADPVSSFSDICRFIGVDPDPNVGSGVHAESVNKWESDPFFTLQIDEETKTMARMLGYSEEELTNPEKSVPSLRLQLRRKSRGLLSLAVCRFRDRVLAPRRLRKRTGNRE